MPAYIHPTGWDCNKKRLPPFRGVNSNRKLHTLREREPRLSLAFLCHFIALSRGDCQASGRPHGRPHILLLPQGDARQPEACAHGEAAFSHRCGIHDPPFGLMAVKALPPGSEKPPKAEPMKDEIRFWEKKPRKKLSRCKGGRNQGYWIIRNIRAYALR